MGKVPSENIQALREMKERQVDEYLRLSFHETDDERAMRILRGAVFTVSGVAVSILAIPIGLFFSFVFVVTLAVLTPFAIIRRLK